MEALIYLASINKIVIDDAMKKRIDSIKQSENDIAARKADDVFETVKGYKIFLVTDVSLVWEMRSK